MTTEATLVLEDGRVFRGEAYGAAGRTFGEAVFSTGMTGYQETLTDPSYHRQVVVMTAPHVGNTGFNVEDSESRRIWVAGFVVRDPSRIASNWRAERTLDDELMEQGIVGIQGIDTRALTRHLRDHGAMRVGIFSGVDAQLSLDDQLQQVQASSGMSGADLTRDVSTPEQYVIPAVGDTKYRVVAVDLGIKSMTPELMATAHHAVALVHDILTRRIPLFGICFGNQILGRALGLSTYKLQFGHRGINQPVKDRRTGKVEVTAHNHGFAVQAPLDEEFATPFGAARVSHVCLNDNVVEGLECLEVPAFSVQYHPEAAAGPHDSAYLFDRFVDLMGGER